MVGQPKVVPITSATKAARSKTASQGTTASPAKVLNTTTTASGSGGGGGDWHLSVETRLTELRTDLRNLLVGGGVVALALLGAGWGTYTAAMTQLRELAVTQQQIAGKIETLDAKVAGRLDLMEQRLGDKSQASPREGQSGAVH
jgi:hypothetical protein